MYLAITSLSESEILQQDLINLEGWDMNFNPSKCHVIHVTRLKTPIRTKYLLHGTELETGKCTDCQISWGHYIRRPLMEHTHK